MSSLRISRDTMAPNWRRRSSAIGAVIAVPSQSLRHPHQLLQAADARRHRLAGMRVVLPRRPRDFADINVAVPVDAEAMRRAELAGGEPGFLVDPAHQLAVARHDAEPRPQIGKLGIDRLVRS